MRDIHERTEFLASVQFSEDQELEIDDVEDFCDSDPHLAAQYIVWLESQNEEAY